MLRRRVIKMGGSLLTWPRWQQAYCDWRRRQEPAIDVLIIGGGVPVNRLRKLDAALGIHPLACHEIALQFMSVQSYRAAGLMQLPRVTQWDACVEHCVLDVTQQIADAPGDLLTSGKGVPLACDWTVTSDSIAAVSARHLGAFELVLLKSAAAPADGISQAAAPNLKAWADNGFVDSAFPQACTSSFRLRAENLRRYGREPHVKADDGG